eukprot:7979032-Pyramimonas_sp.AAC.1
MMLDASDMSCCLRRLLSNHVLSSVYGASDTMTGLAWMSAFARRSPSLTTAARLAAAVTYTRKMVARSKSNKVRCNSNGAICNTSAMQQHCRYSPCSARSNSQVSSSFAEDNETWDVSAASTSRVWPRVGRCPR